MNANRIIVIVLALFILLGLFQGCGAYNTFVKEDQNVQEAWSKVQSAYQRRADLIPNLVETVKGAADFEKSTLTAVIAARAKATSVTVDPSNITPEKLKEFQAAQSGLSQSLGRLLVSVERYPELKANKNFLELQAQLEGTENRIKIARDKFNTAVKGYNTTVKTFPENIFAGIFGFGSKAYFQSAKGSEEAPKVNF